MRNLNGIFHRFGKIVGGQKQQVRRIALDRDNYAGPRYPAMAVIVVGALMSSWAIYCTKLNRAAIQEMVINRQPLAERKREPDLRKFERKVDSFTWPF